MKKLFLAAGLALLIAGCCAQLKQAALTHASAISTDASLITLAIPALKCVPGDTTCAGAVASLTSVAQGLDASAQALKTAVQQ